MIGQKASWVSQTHTSLPLTTLIRYKPTVTAVWASEWDVNTQKK